LLDGHLLGDRDSSSTPGAAQPTLQYRSHSSRHYFSRKSRGRISHSSSRPQPIHLILSLQSTFAGGHASCAADCSGPARGCLADFLRTGINNDFAIPPWTIVLWFAITVVFYRRLKFTWTFTATLTGMPFLVPGWKRYCSIASIAF